MRKVFFLITLSAVLSACSAVKYKEAYRVRESIVDYSRYAEDGFFITESNSVSFEYTPIGSVSVSISPGYDVIGKEIDQYERLVNKYGEELKTANIYDAIDQLKLRCEEMGANGVINLTIKYDEVPYMEEVGYGYKREFKSNRITICGMAIKR